MSNPVNRIEHIPFATQHTAVRPECQPVVDALWRWMDREGLNPMRACERVFGRHPPKSGRSLGAVRGAGVFYPLLHGKVRITERNIEAFKAAGVDLTEPMRAMQAYIDKHGLTNLARAKKVAAKPKPKIPPTTPARAAALAYQDVVVREPAAPGHVIEPKRRAPAAFALTIEQDGRASVHINLVDIDAADALRCVELLRIVGLIKNP